jgi:glutaredoxin
LKKLSFIYLPILFFIYIAVETFLKLNHSSLCESTGCELAGTLIWFEAIYLNYMGMATAFILIVLGWLSYRETISRKLFYMVLFSALFFETVLLGYQYFVSPEMCKFCMGIYGFLFTITVLSTPRRYLLMIIPAIVSVLIALSFLNLPKSKAFVVKDGNYLIQSVTCPHCKKVKEYMGKENISFKKINIESVEAQNFATFMNFKTIPILLIKDGKNVQIINGDKDIIEFFDKKFGEESAVVVVEESVSITATSESTDLFQAAKDEEGCGFASLEKVESDCSK